VFWLMKILKKYWQFVDRPNKDLLKYANIIADRYHWELTVRETISPLTDLLAKEIKRNDDLMESSIERESSLNEQISDLTKALKRYEMEVIHLKDIIQEKNIIIDRINNDPK